MSGSCLYQPLPSYITGVRDAYEAGFPLIVTDDRGLYDQLKAYLKEEQPEDLEKLEFMTTAFCLYISFTAWKLYWIVLLETCLA